MGAADVRSAVRSLDMKSGELVTLVRWDGFSIAAAARLLGMNESTARTRYQRALQRLERVLSERFGVEVDAPFLRPDLTTGHLRRLRFLHEPQQAAVIHKTRACR
ncbi:RNA polymerase sigma factor [Microbacterium insulae]|uniref:RNA polymerase sigma factor n=1 Tax=Microbacterium insulae TaxID=483014 RepID=A0ABW3ALK0_9MICO